MSESKYIYNNEGFATVAMAAVIKHMRSLSLAKAMLILPFLSHQETLDYLKLKNSDVKSIEQLISKKNNFITNFNKRYLNLLPISINSLQILHEVRIITTIGNEIQYNKTTHFNEHDNKLGTRIKDVVRASEKIANILQKDDSELYLQLRVYL